MRCFIFTCFFYVCCFTCSGQQSYKGILLDSITRQPVEFANIGVIGKGIGTVTDEKGAYALTIPDSLGGEKIKISMIGYRAKTYPVKIFKELQQVLVSQSNITLNEVLVSAKKTKVKIAGNDTKTKLVSAGYMKNNLGAEIAVKLNIKHPKTQIRTFMVNINANSINKLPLFRLNIYTVGEKGAPGENILQKNIIIEPKEMTGLITFDLKPYQVYVDSDVFIAIEWIRDLGDVKGLYFSTKLIGSATYARQVSQDKWEKVPAGIGLHAEIAY